MNVCRSVDGRTPRTQLILYEVPQVCEVFIFNAFQFTLVSTLLLMYCFGLRVVSEKSSPVAAGPTLTLFSPFQHKLLRNALDCRESRRERINHLVHGNTIGQILSFQSVAIVSIR